VTAGSYPFKNLVEKAAGASQYFRDKQVEDFNQDEDNDNQLKQAAFALVAYFAEDGKVFFNDAHHILQFAEAHAQIKVFNQALVQLVEVFFIPHQLGGIENVNVFSHFVLRVQGLADKPQHVFPAYFQFAARFKVPGKTFYLGQ
jgi:hypothetical protein